MLTYGTSQAQLPVPAHLLEVDIAIVQATSLQNNMSVRAGERPACSSLADDTVLTVAPLD